MSMNLITVEGLTHSYTDRMLFKEASFSLNEHEKVGIIGINGTGKSTLLKILAGQEIPDQGTMITRRNLRIAYLPQQPEFEPGETMLMGALPRKEEISGNPAEYEADAKSYLGKLGLTQYDQPVSQLSGGQRKRVALVRVLLTPCDVLVLDEPTNHLDGAMSQWLEDHLKNMKTELIMVTHDRYFLDSVVNRIVEIDKGSLYSYSCNYSGFLERKAEREEIEKATERKRQSVLRKEIAWMQRGARARSTKQKAHIARYEMLRDQEAPEQDRQVEIVAGSSRLGKTTIECENIWKGYDDRTLIRDFTYNFLRHDRVGIIGPNGCGKSTLLQIIAGQLSPSSGVIVRPDDLYYIPQHFGQYDSLTIAQALQIDHKQKALHAILAGDASIENFSILNDDWNIEERSVTALDSWGLGQFPLSYPMNLLSGGEKTRVFLAGMDIHNPSVILMDEPTNHLDSSGRQRLYDWVEKWRSTLLVVSHDRTLLNLLPEICELEKHQISYYGGNYEFYKEQKTLMQEALQQRIEEKEKALRTARKVARETAERRDKQNVRGEKRNLKKGVPRIVLNGLQSKSEKSTAKLTGAHQEKAEKLTDERNQLRSSLSPTAALKTDFNNSGLHTGKILVTAEEINFGYHPDQPQLWQAPLSFQLKSGDRLRIEGGNGSGKTTLLKIITGQLQPLKGTLIQANFTYVYLNQEYSIINDRNSILEQAYAFNGRNLPEHEIKIILNRYLFPASEWDKSCRKLSGGEKMRLAFCCLMISNNMPDMFILDEPTNNLDIQSIEIITATIKNYAGTVIAISHDNYFIQEIGVEQSIFLS